MSSELTFVPPPRVLPKPDVLKQNIFEKLEKLNGLTSEQLARVFDVLSEVELERAWQDFVDSGEEGDLSPEAVEAAKLEYRRKHPYGR